MQPTLMLQSLAGFVLMANCALGSNPTKKEIWNDLKSESEDPTMFEIVQSDTDKVHLRTGKVMVGEVKTVKEKTIEFYEFDTDLVYELSKSNIEVIVLSNGRTLTFEKEESEKPAQQPQQPPPVIVKEEGGGSVGLIILASVGVTLILLLIIGAAAQ